MKPQNSDTKYSGSNQLDNTPENQFALYDTPRKLNVELFYEILKTDNLSLLLINPLPEKLSEKQREELAQKLIDVWSDLREFYYSNTNAQSFKNFKENLKRVLFIENEITGCRAALELVKLGINDGFETLKHFKITDTDPDKIHKAILRKETKLEFAKSKLERNTSKDDKKEINAFYTLLASVERQLNRQLNITEINLERWVSYLIDIKAKQEADKQAANKNKHKGKR